MRNQYTRYRIVGDDREVYVSIQHVDTPWGREGKLFNMMVIEGKPKDCYIFDEIKSRISKKFNNPSTLIRAIEPFLTGDLDMIVEHMELRRKDEANKL